MWVGVPTHPASQLPSCKEDIHFGMGQGEAFCREMVNLVFGSELRLFQAYPPPGTPCRRAARGRREPWQWGREVFWGSPRAPGLPCAFGGHSRWSQGKSLGGEGGSEDALCLG